MASIVNCPLQGFVFVAILGLSLAHPQFWDGCTHPDRDYLGGHKQVLPSSDIHFSLLEGGSRGTPVTAYEPSKQYTLRVVPPRRSEGLLTASLGDLDGLGADTSSNWFGKCNNGRGDLRLDFTKRRSIFYANWKAPDASQLPASTHPVEFRATFAWADDSDLVYGIVTIPPLKRVEPQQATSEAAKVAEKQFGRCWQTDEGEVCETLCDKATVNYQSESGGLELDCIFPEE